MGASMHSMQCLLYIAFLHGLRFDRWINAITIEPGLLRCSQEYILTLAMSSASSLCLWCICPTYSVGVRSLHMLYIQIVTPDTGTILSACHTKRRMAP